MNCPFPKRTFIRNAIACVFSLGLLFAFGSGAYAVQQQDAIGRIIRIDLPIEPVRVTGIIRAIETTANELGETSNATRNCIVLQFGQTGTHDQSAYEDCLKIAQIVRRQTKVEMVAFLPHDLTGHSVLIALSCEQIIPKPSSKLGPVLEPSDKPSQGIQATYKEVGLGRGYPTAFVSGILDPSEPIYIVENGAKPIIANQSELDALEVKNKVTTILDANAATGIDGAILRKHELVTYTASSRDELAQHLQVATDRFRSVTVAEAEWSVVRINIRNNLHPSYCNEIKRMISDALSRKANLILFDIDTTGGDINGSREIAMLLASSDFRNVTTVAYVNPQALKDAALWVMACDAVYMSQSANLGGRGNIIVDRPGLIEDLKQIKRNNGRNWSLILGLVDPKTTLHTYLNRDTGETRIFCSEELTEAADEDEDLWQEDQLVDVSDGLESQQAFAMGVADRVVTNIEDIAATFGIDPEQIQKIQRPALSRFLTSLANNTILMGFLFMVGTWCLISEITTPGLGVPGFVALVTLTIFFWAQIHNDTAGILELLLFIIGVISLVLEIYVIPGFGIFGFGGIVLVFTSLILATVNFMIPSSNFEWNELINNMLTLLLSGVFTVTLFLVLRKPLSRMWFAKQLIHTEEENTPQREWNEAMVHLEHLVGKTGKTHTRLSPAGKVIIDGEVIDVISEGDLIDASTEIVVNEVTGNRVVVRRKT